MSKHTPGPWQINAISNEREKMSIIDADMCFVAEVWKTYYNGESRQQANAALIAAAPAMYEALKDLLQQVEARLDARGIHDLYIVAIKAKAALAQAEGKAL